MKAWAIDSYGEDSKLKLRDLTTPEPEVNEVQIEVKAASLNPVDYKIRDGKLKLVMSFDFPLILGHDCSGKIVKVGKSVNKFKVGDEVFVRSEIGTLAEFVTVPETYVALKPKNISFEEAASVPLVGLTSWQALFDHGKLKKGQKVFIPAGSGGVGTLAVQIAKYHGAYVYSNTSGKNLDFVKSLGADKVFNYKEEDFSQLITDIDLVFDTMGGDTQDKSFKVLKEGGRLISIVGPPTPSFVKDAGLGTVMYLGSSVLSAKTRLKAAMNKVNYEFFLMDPESGSTLAEIGSLIEQEKIRPVVDKVYSFDEANEAMAYLEKGHARGKVVVSLK